MGVSTLGTRNRSAKSCRAIRYIFLSKELKKDAAPITNAVEK